MKKINKKKMKLARVFLSVLIFILMLLQFVFVHRSISAEKVECVPLLGWFTMEDHLLDSRWKLSDLQPGDILVTLSTHSMGWRHGHAGLVVDENSVLECVSWGKKSVLVNLKHWETYSHVAVLRVKEVSTEEQKKVVDYALENLNNVPYHLSAGFLGRKAPEPESWQFGLQCSYLVWYAWIKTGYDLDSDGGRLVTCTDLMESKNVEIIESYGGDFI